VNHGLRRHDTLHDLAGKLRGEEEPKARG